MVTEADPIDTKDDGNQSALHDPAINEDAGGDQFITSDDELDYKMFETEDEEELADEEEAPL